MKRNYLSVSALKAFAKSPNHYIAYCNSQFEPTPAMAFGSAVHCKTLEPHLFNERYAIQPPLDRRTKDGKEAYSAFLAQQGNRTILTPDQAEQVENVCQHLTQHDHAVALFEGCQYEQRVEGKISQVPFVGILDAHNAKSGYVVDLKTCRDASPDQFQKDAHNLGYHLQAAAYRLLTGTDRFYWVCVETDAPYNVAVYMQTDKAYETSVIRLVEMVTRWKDWNGKPMSYGNEEIIALDLPNWAR